MHSTQDNEPVGKPTGQARRTAAPYYARFLELPENLYAYLPRSFDVVGKIAVLKLPEALVPYEKAIGRALLTAHKHVKTVCKDLGVFGRYRRRRVKIIAGKRKLFTYHKEYGALFAVDLKHVYFSPRLASERARIAKLVKKDELVLDAFAGVGSFSIAIARTAEPAKVYAIDINPKALELLRKNVQLNKVIGVVVPLLGDAAHLLPALPSCERLIMNLPHRAHEFLEIALAKIKSRGTIHYYEIVKRTEVPERLAALRRLTSCTDISVGMQKPYSATHARVCFDLRFE